MEQGLDDDLAGGGQVCVIGFARVVCSARVDGFDRGRGVPELWRSKLFVEHHIDQGGPGSGAQAVNLQDPRGRGFARRVRELERAPPWGAGVRAQGREFVDSAQGRLVVGGDQPGAHSPDVDGRTRSLERSNPILVQIVAGDHLGGGETRRVELGTGRSRQAGEVARVQAYADHLVAPAAQLEADLDRPVDPPQRVVGVDQKHAVVGHGVGVGRERLALVVEGHDPGVGVGAPHRDPKAGGRGHVRGSDTPAHIGRPAGREPTVEALGPAQAELEHRVTLGCGRDPGGLGGDQGLKIEDRQQPGLEQLALEQGPADPEQGLVREAGRALGHGVEVDAGAQLAQPIEEGRVEQGGAVVAL